MCNKIHFILHGLYIEYEKKVGEANENQERQLEVKIVKQWTACKFILEIDLKSTNGGGTIDRYIYIYIYIFLTVQWEFNLYF